MQQPGRICRTLNQKWEIRFRDIFKEGGPPGQTTTVEPTLLHLQFMFLSVVNKKVKEENHPMGGEPSSHYAVKSPSLKRSPQRPLHPDMASCPRCAGTGTSVSDGKGQTGGHQLGCRTTTHYPPQQKLREGGGQEPIPAQLRWELQKQMATPSKILAAEI